MYADVPAISNGSVTAVLFVGSDSQVTDVYGIKTGKQFVNTLEDNIIQRGAPHKLISIPVHRSSLETKFKIFCELCVSVTGRVSHTNNIRMRLNVVIKLSNVPLTACLTEPCSDKHLVIVSTICMLSLKSYI
jgi:hypothetical protein